MITHIIVNITGSSSRNYRSSSGGGGSGISVNSSSSSIYDLKLLEFVI